MNEIDQFRYFSPSGKIIYKSQIHECDIKTINKVLVNDYFNIESDVLLTYVYRSIKLKTTHPLLLEYMVYGKRWDLVLMTLDVTRKMDRQTQIMALNYLFYQPLPSYFISEIKELFNFFSSSEKITISQQLIPNTPLEIKHLNKRNNYIFEFWPLFDQMVFINHLKELYPSQFEKFAEFWHKELISYYYDDVVNQNPSFKLLSQILNREINMAPIKGANSSLQAYYFLKINAFTELGEMIDENKYIYFNLLRYFQLFSIDQQKWMLSLDIELSISDIEYLFRAYFFQVDHLSFRTWLWTQAIRAKFNFETYFQRPNEYLSYLPVDRFGDLDVLSPTRYFIENESGQLNHFYEHDPTATPIPMPLTKKQLSHLTRFYNDFKVLPFTSTQPIISNILPYITLTTYQQFFDLIPYTTFDEQLNLIERNPFLELIPVKNQAGWNRMSQPWLRPN